MPAFQSQSTARRGSSVSVRHKRMRTSTKYRIAIVALFVGFVVCAVGLDHSIQAITEAKGRREIRLVHAWRYCEDICVIGGIVSAAVFAFLLLSPDRRKKAFPPSDDSKPEPNQTAHPTTL